LEPSAPAEFPKAACQFTSSAFPTVAKKGAAVFQCPCRSPKFLSFESPYLAVRFSHQSKKGQLWAIYRKAGATTLKFD